jgi:hypothetical protein
MKLLLLFGILTFSQISLSEGLLLKSDLDPRELQMPNGYKLWSEIQAEGIKNRSIREDVMNNSSLFLENRISQSDFLQFLKNWSDLGFSEQERIILVDTLQKSMLSTTQKNQWLCRLDLERNCSRIKIFPKHLAPILQKFEWLAIDGQTYPRMSWDEISIADENLTWVFLSSRFETYTFRGKWEDLKFKSPTLNDWINGNCKEFKVRNEVQSLDNNVMLNRNCVKSSLPVADKEASFFQKHQKSLFVAAGLALLVGVTNSMNGKKIILEKPSFR